MSEPFDAVILAGGRGSRLKELTDRRAKPAVYFGGKTRIIDFALSNALNSGIRKMALATQYKAHSLIRHLEEWGDDMVWEYDPAGLRVLLRSAHSVLVARSEAAVAFCTARLTSRALVAQPALNMPSPAVSMKPLESRTMSAGRLTPLIDGSIPTASTARSCGVA